MIPRQRFTVNNQLSAAHIGRKAHRSLSVLLFLACGMWLIGLGFYFAVLRPPLLPEDARYIGVRAELNQSALPGLTGWLRHVFTVMGGFMVASGVLTSFLAATAVSSRQKGTGMVLVVVGLATVGTMSWTNFAIDSDFKWLLVAPVVLWFAGIAVYARARRE